MASSPYRAAWWLPGGHLQTLWPKFFRRRAAIATRGEWWPTPDGDALEIQRLDAPAGAPRVFVVHGLEGTIRSHYLGGFLEQASARGWGADLLLFRGCGSRPSTAPRFYHSGETGDLAFALARVLREHPESPVVLAGVSLGGNVLLKYLGERGDDLPPQVRGAAVISVPFDLERGARRLMTGLSRMYDQHFLRSLRQKAAAKLVAYPDLFDQAALRRARSIFDFDDAVTAPVHGFRDAHEYYTQSSALRWLERVRLRTLLLSACDDPFLPPAVLDEVRAVAARSPNITVEFTRRGGHVGFVTGGAPWNASFYAERRVCDFLASCLPAV